MTPREELERLCRRHGLPLELARSLLPLVRRAARASPALRRRMLAVVDEALRREAAEIRGRERRGQELDQRVLLRVAAVLHRWEPFDGRAADGRGEGPGGRPRRRT